MVEINCPTKEQNILQHKIKYDEKILRLIHSEMIVSLEDLHDVFTCFYRCLRLKKLIGSRVGCSITRIEWKLTKIWKRWNEWEMIDRRRKHTQNPTDSMNLYSNWFVNSYLLLDELWRWSHDLLGDFHLISMSIDLLLQINRVVVVVLVVKHWDVIHSEKKKMLKMETKWMKMSLLWLEVKLNWTLFTLKR